VSLDKSTSDINSHLSRCHLGHEAISEGDLILARLGCFVCPRCRRGICLFVPSTMHILVNTGQSQTPASGHKGGHKAAKTDCAFTLAIVQDVWKAFGVLVPIGVCKYH
jgi:hypothetical protein